MGVNLEGVKYFIQTADGENVEIKGGVQEVSIASDQMVESDFDFSREISVPCTFEEPKNIKELQDIGFTLRQAWNIHLRKGESWKEN
ncbi:hypothetical protein bcere0007_3080 [Bacillus mycoides]|uniref:hypothetical protein n=1 Tax=Bacillus mycoides TaxID=1405 RepID=UPI0001A0411D|nr:hypothetical protein [Bacillus mycoides]EEK75182.1 hypothetical protein bcere0007_3080 [Bacillus mycoides]